MHIPLAVYQAINLLNAVLSLCISIFVLRRGRNSRQAVLFSAFAFLVFLWAFFYFLAFQTTNLILTRFYFRTCMIAAALLLPVFTEFAYTLTDNNIKTVYRLINFGLAGVFVVSVYSNIYAFDGGPFLVFPYWPIIGPLSLIQIMHYCVNLWFALGVLLQASISAAPILRQQAKVVFWGTTIGFSGGFTNFLLWFRVPFPPILNILIPFYIISVAYAIMRHRLMDIRIIIRKTAIYSVLTVLITGIILSFVLVGEFLFRRLIGYSSIWAVIVAAFAVAVIFRPLQEKVQRVIDRIFFKGKYDYPKALKQISEDVSQAMSVEDINRKLDKELKGFMGASKAEVRVLR